MCFNLSASLVAGTIGVTAGAFMRTSVGVFVIFYSLVQYGEAAIYAGCYRKVWERVLVILLGSQLAVFTAATWKNNDYYKAMALAGGGLALWSALAPVDHPPSCGGLEYAFTPTTSKLMFAQYAIIFGAAFAQPQYRCMGGVLAATLLGSVVARPYAHASLWCWSSAVAAPILLFGCKA